MKYSSSRLGFFMNRQNMTNKKTVKTHNNSLRDTMPIAPSAVINLPRAIGLNNAIDKSNRLPIINCILRRIFCIFFEFSNII